MKPAILFVLFVLPAIAAPVAHADLWGYVDEAGKAHFATEALDSRYQLFFKGPTNLDEPAPATATPPDFAGAGAIIRERVTGHPNVTRFSPLIESHAKARGLDPALVKAIVAVESAFDPAAVSPKGAVGLMQVIPATAERYGVAADRRRTVAEKLKDPVTNVRVGTRYLADLVRLFDEDLTLALAAYNAGEQAVERHARNVPPYPETRAYVALVQQFRMLYTPAPPRLPPTRIVVPRTRSPR